MGGRCWLVSVFLFAGLTVAWADNPLVDPLPTAAVEVTNVAAEKTIRLPFMAKENVEVTSVTPIAVTSGGALELEHLATFGEARIDAASLVVKVPAQRLDTKPYDVSYLVVGQVTAADGKRSRATQTVTLKVNVIAPKLRALTPIVINETACVPWGTESVTGTVRLAELSKRSQFTMVSVEQSPVESGGTFALVAGQTIAPGGTLPVTLSGTGFETGTTKGSLSVSAKELAEPIVVAYEVRVKVHEIYIAICFLVFGFIGWLVRHFLKEREASATFRTQVEPLRQLVTKEKARVSAETARKLETARVALDTAIAAGDQVKAQAAADALKAALDAAIGARAKRIEELWQVVTTLRQVGPSWDIPADLARLKVTLDDVEDALADTDERRASEILDGVVPILAASIRRWADETTQALATAGDKLALAPAASRTDIAALVADARKKVAAVPAYDPVKPPSLAEYLPPVHDARRTVRRVAELAEAALRHEVNETAAALRKIDKEAAAAAVTSAGSFAPGTDEPTTRVLLLGKALEAFRDEVKKHVDDESVAFLKEGKYAAAVLNTHALATNADSRPQISAAIASVQKQIETVQLSALDPKALAKAVVPVVQRAVDPVKLAQRELVRWRFGNGIVSAALLSAGAWLIYRGSWVGTIDDFVKVAAVAFFSDFTVTAVVDALGKLKPAQT